MADPRQASWKEGFVLPALRAYAGGNAERSEWRSERLLLVTGAIGAGKTTFCKTFIDSLRDRSAATLDVAGILTPGLWQAGRKVGIEAMDLRTGETRHLACLRNGAFEGQGTAKWAFHPGTVEWANHVLAKAVPCKVLVVDELGPLEWLRGEGFMAGMEAADSGRYQCALVVVRDALLEHAIHRWPQAVEVRLESITQAREAASHWAQTLELR